MGYRRLLREYVESLRKCASKRYQIFHRNAKLLLRDFFPIAFPVRYSRTIVAFNCIYQLPEAVGIGINSLECIFKLVNFTDLTMPIKI